MAENGENVKVTDKGTEEMEKNVVDEKMEGKEEESGKEEGEVKEEVPEKKQESAFDRFLGWFRGKPKIQEADEREDEEEKNETIDNEKEAKEIDDNKEVNEQEGEMENDEKTLKIQKNGIEKEKNFSEIVESKGTKHVSNDHTLVIIEEEDKRENKVAPLAQEEDEDIEEAFDSRKSIDRPVIEPKSAEAVQAEREITEKEALPEDDIDAKTEKKKSATVFLKLSQPSFERQSEESADRENIRVSEHDDRIEDKTKLVDTQQAVPKHNQPKSKMEEVIEEKRHDDRTESMQETWKRVEELEPSKTYRVSYTITTTTTTTEKSGRSEDKPADDDDDDERLFGDSVLLPNNEQQSKKKFDGPPPQDLEPELTYEEAKKDEAGSADIDKIFDMMAKDGGPPPEDHTVEVVTVESARQEEDSQEIPETPEDIFRKLQNWDKEPTDWWTSTKKKRDYEEWMKPMKDGTIRRVIIPNVEIPYDACVRFVTDWKYREEWDKTFSEIKILKDSKDSKLIYCPVKKRDLAFETLDRKENDPPSYILTWKRQMVDKEGQEVEASTEDKKQLQLITHACGIILRPSESGEQATYITILCQLEGPVDKALKNTFLAGHPKSWLRSLNKYYKKQQKGAQQKVVYL